MCTKYYGLYLESDWPIHYQGKTSTRRKTCAWTAHGYKTTQNLLAKNVIWYGIL